MKASVVHSGNGLSGSPSWVLMRVVLQLILALTPLTLAGAQAGGNSYHAHSTPSIDDQVRTLSQQLKLTSKQEETVKAILLWRNEQLMKVRYDPALSAVDRFNTLRGVHENADKQIRTILDGDQVKTFDQLRHHGSPPDTPSPRDSTPPPSH